MNVYFDWPIFFSIIIVLVEQKFKQMKRQIFVDFIL